MQTDKDEGRQIRWEGDRRVEREGGRNTGDCRPLSVCQQQSHSPSNDRHSPPLNSLSVLAWAATFLSVCRTWFFFTLIELAFPWRGSGRNFQTFLKTNRLVCGDLRAVSTWLVQENSLLPNMPSRFFVFGYLGLDSQVVVSSTQLLGEFDDIVWLLLAYMQFL